MWPFDYFKKTADTAAEVVDAGESQTDAIYGGSAPEPRDIAPEQGFDWGATLKDGALTALKRITNYDLYEIVVKDTQPEDFTSPNVFTRAKAGLNQKVSDTTSAITGGFAKWGLLILALLFILIVGYGTALYAVRKKVIG